MNAEQQKVIEIPKMRDHVRVFKNRSQAGKVLAGMESAAVLNIPLEIAVVSKITLPWNTEAGFGAVAFNGTIKLNESLISRLRLSDSQVRDGIASGVTLLTGIDALKSMGPAGIFAASPTGNLDSVPKVAAETDLVFCANILSGWTFAVADTYEE